MVLQYNGITKMPNNAGLNPGTLNAWLKSQPDGYIDNGLVNWLAISRLSRLIKLAFNNPSYTADGLEWKWLPTNSNTLISADLQKNIPDILNEPGHFIVTKGTQGTTFTINDPAQNKTLLTDYGNTFISAGKFVPSHTDLSYILLVGPQDVSFDLKTASGSSIGQTFIQQQLANDFNPGQTSGSPRKIFYAEQPQADTYKLTVSSPSQQLYEIKEYSYDQTGNVVVDKIEGTADNSHPNSFTLSFSKSHNDPQSVKRQVTTALLLFDLQTLYKRNFIKKSTYSLLFALLNNIQKADDKKKVIEEKVLLKTASLFLHLEKPFGISQQAYELLNQDIVLLLKPS